MTTGRILCRPSYSFPASISPISSADIYDKSLYEAEEYANKFETELIQAVTGLPNIRWWHRNIARTGFAINGVINHYPDLIVRTRSGKSRPRTPLRANPPLAACFPAIGNKNAGNAQQNALLA